MGSPYLCGPVMATLRGHDVQTVHDLALASASDGDVLRQAHAQGARVVIDDADFGKRALLGPRTVRWNRLSAPRPPHAVVPHAD